MKRLLPCSAAFLVTSCALAALNKVDYATNGCVANYDALLNQGAAAVRDAQATEWVNAANPSEKISFTKSDIDTGHWSPQGYRFHRSYAQFPKAIDLGSQLTIQIAADHKNTNYASSGNCWPNYLAAKEADCGLYTVNQNMSLNWKINDSGGVNIVSTRPVLNNWNGKTINAMIDSQYAYLFHSADKSSGVKQALKSGAKGLGSKTFEIGSRDYNPWDRYVNNEIFAVRLYNRTLTDQELTDHLILDDLRFRNTPPDEGIVQIVSTWPGVNAATTDGIYRMDGETALTIGEGTDGAGNTYACAGYTLEQWNAETTTWDQVGESTTSDEVMLAEGASKRLLIHWVLKSGKVALDANAYPNFLMMANFDAIRNQGANAPHSTTTSVWADLAGGGGNATYAKLYGRDFTWMNTACHFNAGGGFEAVHPVAFGKQYSFLLALDYIQDIQQAPVNGIKGYYYPRFFINTGSDFGLYVDSNYQVSFKIDSVTDANYSTRPVLPNWAGYYLTAIHDDTKSYLFDGTGLSAAKTHTRKSNPSMTYSLGFSRKADGDDAAHKVTKDMQSFRGAYFAARAYNRFVSTPERVRIRELDQIRFKNAIAAKNMIVVDSRDPACEDASCAPYQVAGSGPFVFTAPVAPEGYASTGYTLETLDAKGNWTGSTHHAETTCTIAGSADGIVSQHIVWEWKKTANLFTNKYSSLDYVQDGLVAHYDAIDNAGVGCHGADREFWQDLSLKNAYLYNQFIYSGKDSTGASFTNTIHNVADVGWSETAYKVRNHGAMRTRTDLNLGAYCTVQEAVTVTNPTTDNKNYWPNLFTYGVKDCGAFVRNSSLKTLELKEGTATGTDAANSKTPSGSWKGQYVNAVWASDFVAVFEGTSYANKYNRSGAREIGQNQWSFGTAVVWEGGYHRFLNGDYHAIRIYNRALTEAELAKNRAIDENRYRGGPLMTTNVLVCSSSKWAKGVEDGAYLQQGTHTFTAESVTDEKGRTWKPTGYTLASLENGQWSAPVAHTGTSCDITIAEDTKPVRLTWNFQGPGLTLILR